MTNCGVCTEVITALPDSIKCDGPCNMSIHAKCASLTRTAIKIINESSNLLFLCDHCKLFSFKEITDHLLAIKTSISNLSDAMSAQSERTAKLTDEVAANTIKTDKLASSSMTPVSVLRQNGQTSISQKRRRMDASPSAPRNASPAPLARNLVVGSAENACGLQSVEPRKIVVASQLHNSTTVEQLKAFISEKLATGGNQNTIRCNMMLPNGRSVEDVDFLSFKVSVPESLYDRLLNADIWPKGVTVREFVHRNANTRRLGHFLPAPLTVTSMSQ